MLTLPVQGFAAAVRASCGTDHSTAQLIEQAVASEHVAEEMHQHHDAIDKAAIMPTSHDTSARHVSHHHHEHKNAFCGSCGSCCVGAFAMMSTHVWAPEFHQASVEIVAPSPLVTGYIPDGLERPPRKISL